MGIPDLGVSFLLSYKIKGCGNKFMGLKVDFVWKWLRMSSNVGEVVDFQQLSYSHFQEQQLSYGNGFVPGYAFDWNS
ncbi:hypothetical protein HanRHA438_Chr12g0552651 [Helianthus annuus]|nr:hypothetical protein HanRHA438_Chr12g0552651 [Helianthus annuus]